MNWLSQFVVRLNIYCITLCPKAACTLGEEMQTLLMEMATPLPEHTLDQVLHRSALAQLLEQHTDLFFLWRSPSLLLNTDISATPMPHLAGRLLHQIAWMFSNGKFHLGEVQSIKTRWVRVEEEAQRRWSQRTWNGAHTILLLTRIVIYCIQKLPNSCSDCDTIFCPSLCSPASIPLVLLNQVEKEKYLKNA